MIKTLSRFLQVGAIGFAVDAGLLWLLIYQFDMPPVLSRGISFMVTICITFVLNARYTFVVAAKGTRMPKYVAVQLAGATINFLVYTWLVLAGPLQQRPLVALVVGSALASIHNFLMMRRFVFNDKRREADRSNSILS